MTPVALLGATASGKSAVALEVARRHPGTELVSIDAMQVYRGMDLGTAKPTAAERAEVPHHGLDLVDPGQEYTVAEFQRSVLATLADLDARGAPVLCVGGTGLYLRAVIDALELPGSFPEWRATFEADPDLDGLYRRLQALDPAAAARIEPGNRRRIVRALEVCAGSGRRFSSFGPGLDTYPPTRFVQIGLCWERAALAARIEARVHQMLDAGLLDETRALLARGPVSRTARQALGYRELIEYLEGHWGYEEAVAAIVTRTRQFAVRQDRWFRRDPRIRWITVTSDPVAEAAPAVLEALQSA